MQDEVPGDPDDVPDTLRLGFWKTVLVTNAALLGLALGGMLWFFERSPWAVPAAGAGAVATVHAWILYRRYHPRHRDDGYE